MPIWTIGIYKVLIMQEREFKKLLDKHLSGTLTPEEKKILETFEQEMLNRSDDTQYMEGQLDVGSRIFHGVKEKIWTRKRVYGLKVAAAVALLVALGTMGRHLIGQNDGGAIPEIVQATQWGEKATIDLPDGTKIKLNSGSTLTFPKTFGDSIREVELIGEAFFEVARDPKHPFIIRSGEVTTEVLGTSFNIQAYRDHGHIEVTVATGLVKVRSDAENEVYLKPSDQAVFNKADGSISTKSIDPALFPGWKDNILRFDNVALGDAVVQLEKWYGASITIEEESAKRCTFTGKFKNEKLDNVLKSLAKLKKGLEPVMVSMDSIVIKGSCK